MKRIRKIILLMAMMFAWTLNAQVDTIVTASGELGNSGSDLEFLNESGGLTRFPRLSDAGELLYYPPIVTTDSVTNITSTSAMVYGNILFNGWYENVQEQGFQLSTTADFSGSVTTQAITSDNPYSDCDLPCLENAYLFIFTDLTPTTTYYVRAYATNEQGTAYGDTLQFATPFGCGISTVQDYDGNVYNTVQIGSQCWTKENLRTTHYADGTSISQGNSTSTTTAYWYYPDDNASNMPTYGLLYNWKALTRNSSSSSAIPSGVQGICPTGWHVPSDAEWKQMEIAVGMSQSDADRTDWRGSIVARFCSNTGWPSSTNANAAGNTSAAGRNFSGFSALPAGCHTSSYNNFGSSAYFWSATENSSTGACVRHLGFNRAGVCRDNFGKSNGAAVRCVHDMPVPLGELPLVTTNIVTNITYTTATCGGNVVYEGSSAVTVRGVCWSTSQNPTVEDSHTEDGNGQGSFVSTMTNLTTGATYYVRAYAINSTGMTYGEEMSFSLACGISTVTDYDGNVYNTVQIGSQCWTKENLKTTHYMNGTAIPLGSTKSTTVAYRYNPNNDAANVADYGYLYNWPAVMNGEASSNTTPSGVQGICPDGWHVPSDAEWKQMEMAVGMSQSDADATGWRGSIAARLCGNMGWQSSSTADAAGNISATGRNSSGFSALPAGNYSGSYDNFGANARFWSATENSNINAWLRYLGFNYAGVHRAYTNKGYGYSVRCVRDIVEEPCSPTSSTHNIEITTGQLPYAFGDTTFLAGSETGTYILHRTNAGGCDSTITLNLTITVFTCGTSTLSDIDGNTYNTVLIDNQCWMKENLRTTRYADNTPIAQGSETSTTTAYWYYPNNTSSNMSTYGLLYNWKAVMGNSSSSGANPSGVQGICPMGWHVPSDEEWTQLTSYVSSQSEYVCGSNNTYIAKALAGTTGWTSRPNTCAVGNTPDNNNATGFSALPAGNCSGSYHDFGNYANFWSATESSSDRAYGRGLGFTLAWVSSSLTTKSFGYSVRCLRDEGGVSAFSLPTVTTTAVTNITDTTASCGGNVTDDGGATVIARGVCWSSNHNPTISDSRTTDGTGTGTFTSNITGLISGTTYVRAYATNSVGTSYGGEVSFTHPCPGAATLTDIDGNTYNTVQIGSQCWMKENLRTTKYADNTPIAQSSETPNTSGYNNIAYWFCPNDDASNKDTYGLLYNWKAVMGEATSSEANPSGVQGICPTGWHVPSDAEWKQMEMAVGMSQSDADATGWRGSIAARLCGNMGWQSSSTADAAGNISATGRNSSGFSALPAGYYGSYFNFGISAIFWSATETNSTDAWYRTLDYNNAGVGRSTYNKNASYSVRCVRD